VFPVKAGVESAIGLLMAEPAFDVARTRIIRLDAENVKEINQLYAGLEREGRKQLRMSGVSGNVKFSRSAEMRFVGQGFELTVDLPPREYRATDIAGLRRAFFDVYTATYGGGAFDESDAIEVVHWRLTALCPISELKLGAIGHGDGDATRALKGSRPVYFPEWRGFRECPVYDRYALRAGDRIEGSAIIEERESTLVLIPSSTAITDDFGNVVVELTDVDNPKVHA
jgi:N-methylhydantoinase A